MADDLTPGQVRARQFDVARKGYERSQVDAFLAEIAERLGDLETRLDASRGELAVGIDDEQALARELHTIGEQVGEILEAARSAAEGMRSRASSDATAWRSDAEERSTAMLDEAGEQSQSMRAAAWNEGSSLLASAAAEAESIIAAAKEEALFVRAEAEREALRLTGDAKRDREETIRASRLEADQIVEAARIESDGVLAAAAQQAELAQERARALEDRRSELLKELEATRASISDLEQEIDSRRRELEEPDPEPEPEPERSHHTSDGGSVRIVAPSNVVRLEPVDAEELAAEVEALRSSEHTESVSVIDDIPPVSTPAEPDVVVIADPPPEPATVVSPDAAPAETVIEDATPEEPPTELADDIVEEAAEEAAEPVVDEVDVPDDLGALFAQLREPTPDADIEAEAPAAAEPAPTPEPTPNAEPTATAEPSEAPASAPAIEQVVPSEPVTDAAAVLPAQNEALRSIKRSLVDLQNETLEHLRTDPSWAPDEAFTDRFGEPFAQLDAAVDGSIDPGAGSAFGIDLFDALLSALDHARDAGSGDREIAAAASKVFRTWRSDEAERRVFSAVDGVGALS